MPQIMAFQNLAAELVHQIYNTLPTISDVINLSLTCHRMNSLLRNAQKLSTLFSVADREFGPIEDIKMLLTYNHSLPAYVKRDPAMSYALLRQMIAVGMVGKRFEELYPSIRWQNDFLNRRTLSHEEGLRIRQAVYRYWLYSEAFHNRLHPRAYRLLPGAVEERSKLLRSWSTKSLIDIEDVRNIMEDVLTFQICPTDGTVQQRVGKDVLFGVWLHSNSINRQTTTRVEHTRTLFHSAREDCDALHSDISPVQARTTRMDGWGDEVSQYYYVQSLLKLNPAQILWLYDHATYKWQVETLVRELGEDWFWNNGQTFSDTWIRVMHARGEDVQEVRSKVFDCVLGVAVNGYDHDAHCERDVRL